MKLIRDMGIQKFNPLILEWQIFHVNNNVRVVKVGYEDTLLMPQLRLTENDFSEDMVKSIISIEKSSNGDLYVYCSAFRNDTFLYTFEKEKNSDKYKARLKMYEDIVSAFANAENSGKW